MVRRPRPAEQLGRPSLCLGSLVQLEDNLPQVVAAIKQAHSRPKVLVQGSAIGFYGVHGDEELTEASPSGSDFLAELEQAIRLMYPRPKVLILNFPLNPTTQCVDLPFFARIIAICSEYNIYVVHDLAYADLVFDGYQAPSILQVPGAREVAVEFFTLSKSYNMPGWRVGFMVGNRKLVAALTRLKSYFDYGTFTPIQVAAICAIEGPQDCTRSICDIYRKRRDCLVAGLGKLQWKVESPKATMFVWAPIPEPYRKLGSLEFSKKLLSEAQVAVSPGIGFGEYGDDHIRFALIENEERTHQALRTIKKMFKHDGF